MDERERPVEVERETTIIQTGDRGSGGTIAVVLVLLVVVVGLFLFFGGYLQSAADDADININVDMPKVELPDVSIEAPSAPAPEPAESNAQ